MVELAKSFLLAHICVMFIFVFLLLIRDSKNIDNATMMKYDCDIIVNRNLNYIKNIAKDERLSKLFRDVKRAWDENGEKNPYWGVLTHPKWNDTAGISDEAMYEFWKTGEYAIKKSLKNVRSYIENGLIKDIDLTGSALDFGCGVCRLSIPLSQYFNKVFSIDISENYIKECIKNAKQFNTKNIYPVLNHGIINLDEYGKNIKVDFILSLITIQNNPPDIQQEILKQLLYLLNDDGIAYLHIPYGVKNKSLHNEQGIILRASKETIMQMHFTPSILIEYIAKQAHCELIDSFEFPHGGNLKHAIFIIRKVPL